MSNAFCMNPAKLDAVTAISKGRMLNRGDTLTATVLLVAGFVKDALSS